MTHPWGVDDVLHGLCEHLAYAPERDGFTLEMQRRERPALDDVEFTIRVGNYAEGWAERIIGGSRISLAVAAHHDEAALIRALVVERNSAHAEMLERRAERVRTTRIDSDARAARTMNLWAA